MRKFTNYSLSCTKRAFMSTVARMSWPWKRHVIAIRATLLISTCSSNKCVYFTWKCSLRWSEKLTGSSKKEKSQKETVHMTPNKTFNTSAEKWWKNMEHILMECAKERACDSLHLCSHTQNRKRMAEGMKKR